MLSFFLSLPISVTSIKQMAIIQPPHLPVEERHVNPNDGNLYGLPLAAGSYTISSLYGERRGSRLHRGIDLSAPIGTPILSIRDGIVIASGWDGAYGYRVIVDHGNGVISLYAHMSATGTNVGTILERGRVIGWVGNTGRSTGPHLHLEIRHNNERINPLLALNL